MIWYLDKILHASPSSLKSFIIKPWMLFILIISPKTLNAKQLLSHLFPKERSSAYLNVKSSFETNHDFFQSIEKKMMKVRKRPVKWQNWVELLYMIIRYQKPDYVIETGVFDGQSSAIILQALYDNNKGCLISVDLPSSQTIHWSTHLMQDTVLPLKCKPGWIIPKKLRKYHKLIIGDSRIVLPKLLKKYPKIDIFLHDSLHTTQCQLFEYEKAWPHILPGGLLLSDDIYCNTAFFRFCCRIKRSYCHLESFGIIRK